jgi:hypothetical protein
MTDEHYKPPATPVEDAPRPPGSPFVAVLVGLVVDIGGTLLAGILFTLIFTILRASKGGSAADVETALAALASDTGFRVVSSIVGLSFSVLGGYVCARIARRNEYRLAGVQALVTTFVGYALGGAGTLELGYEVALTILSAVAVFAGAARGQRYNELRQRRRP